MTADEDRLTYPPEEVDYARSMMTCPWYLGIGICASGCWSEPSCETDAPTEGWQHILDNPDPPITDEKAAA